MCLNIGCSFVKLQYIDFLSDQARWFCLIYFMENVICFREMRLRCAAQHTMYFNTLSLTKRKKKENLKIQRLKNTAARQTVNVWLRFWLTNKTLSFLLMLSADVSLVYWLACVKNRISFELCFDVWFNNPSKTIAFYFVPCYMYFEVSWILTIFFKPTKIISGVPI